MAIVKRLYVWRAILALYLVLFFILTFSAPEVVQLKLFALLILLSAGGLLVIRSYLLERKIILGKVDLEVNQVWLRRTFTMFSLTLLIACLAILSGFR